MNQFTYLALGDSYTIGEQVRISESFPYQTVQVLRDRGLNFTAPEIIATTGWTTDELEAQIETSFFLPAYDAVSLLIGVNNQYRGRSVADFEIEFERLLQRAIKFAANKADRVYVISIPDWGVTPFAKERDTAKIADEIDEFNTVCASIASKYATHYLDITISQRADGSSTDFLAADQLHPSGKEYAKWAHELSSLMMESFFYND